MNTDAIPKIKRQSDYLFEHMNGHASKEECERTVKEIRLNEIRAYCNYFQRNLHKNIKDLSEEQLDEITSAVKFLFRIESATVGYLGEKINFRP